MTPSLRPTSRAEAVHRAQSMAGPAGRAIVYRLADRSGGRDPFALDPASHWRSPVLRMPIASCDCAGFVAWALGYDRFQPADFPLYGGWINCDSMGFDANGSASFFRWVEIPQAGDLIAFPSIDLDHDGARDRIGHVGLIVAVAPRWVPGAYGHLRVAHCSPSHQRPFGQAIAITTAGAWAGRERYRGETRARWGAGFLRYQRFTP